MSSELVKPLGLEAWMVERLSTLRRIADEVAGLRCRGPFSSWPTARSGRKSAADGGGDRQNSGHWSLGGIRGSSKRRDPEPAVGKACAHPEAGS